MTLLKAKADPAGSRLNRATSASRKKTFWLTTMMLPGAVGGRVLVFSHRSSKHPSIGDMWADSAREFTCIYLLGLLA